MLHTLMNIKSSLDSVVEICAGCWQCMAPEMHAQALVQVQLCRRRAGARGYRSASAPADEPAAEPAAEAVAEPIAKDEQAAIYAKLIYVLTNINLGEGSNRA